jgi:hypothetical protein
MRLGTSGLTLGFILIIGLRQTLEKAKTDIPALTGIRNRHPAYEHSRATPLPYDFRLYSTRTLQRHQAAFKETNGLEQFHVSAVYQLETDKIYAKPLLSKILRLHRD